MRSDYGLLIEFCVRGEIQGISIFVGFYFVTSSSQPEGGGTKIFSMLGNKSDSNINWYAAKSVSASVRRVKAFLVEHEVPHFMPFREVVAEKNGKRVKTMRPVAANYVFIHGTPELCRSLVADHSLPLSFLRNRTDGGLLEVPGKQMEDFMQLYDLSSKAFLILNDNLKVGDKVRITHGDFRGIEGELIRIKGHKRVVVRLQGLFSLAVNTYIPKEFIEVLR